MLEKLKRQGKLHPDTVVFEITEEFGEFTNDKDGNLTIRKEVLRAFRKLTKDSVVWIQEDRYWRMRDPHDGPGRLGEAEPLMQHPLVSPRQRNRRVDWD
jgi:uncharacterized protein DUF6953